MSAIVVEIAEAVADALNGASLSLPFTVERACVPVYEETDSDLRVYVTPKPAVVVRPLARGSAMYQYTVWVSIHKRCGRDNAETDPLMMLSQEISDLFVMKPLTGCPEAKNVPIEDHVPFIASVLDDKGVFVAVLPFTYEVARDLS